MATGRQFGQLEGADIAVIAGYFALTLAVGFWAICKPQSSLSGYFLAGRSMTWGPIGMSLFASNIGSINFVGIAGSAAASGLAVVMFEWNAIWLLVLLGWVFVPVYIGSGIYTMPEYLQWRFGGERLRIYLSVIALLTYIFVTLSTDLYSGALFVNQTLGWNIYAGVALILVIAMVFTALGGLTTVILTDAVAVIVMITGGAALMVVGFIRVGGMAALQHKYMNAVSDYALNNSNSSCGYPREDAWHIFRDPLTADYPSVGTFLRCTIGALWFWCANQLIVQRALAAKNITHAKGGTLLAGYLKLTPMFLMVFPGMISRVLFPNEVACADPETCNRVCGISLGCSNIALPRLVVELLPNGMRGLLVAAMIAAVVSTLTSIFNSSTTLFTMDIWNKIRPRASEAELLIVGRLFVVVLTALSVVWIPLMQNQSGGQIFVYSTTITGLMGAPTCAVFILAFFWKRVNEQGAFWGMVIAQLWGMSRFVLGFVYPDPQCGEIDDRPSFMKDFHAYYHTVAQIAIAFLCSIVISLVTKADAQERLAGLTFWTRHEKPLKDYEYERSQLEEEEDHKRQALLTIVEEKETTEKVEIVQKSYLTNLKVRFIKAMFGTTKKRDNRVQVVEPHSDRMKHLQQTKFWTYFLNIQMVGLLAVTTFCYIWWR